MSKSVQASLVSVAVMMTTHSVSAGNVIINNEHNIGAGKIIIDGVEYGRDGATHGPGIKGSGKMARDVRSVKPFKRVRISGGFEVLYQSGQEYRVDLSGDDNIIPWISSNVSGDELLLTTKKSFTTQSGIKIVVTAPTLQALTLDGSADVTLNDLRAPSFTLTATGSGDITASGQVGDLTLSVSGAGNIDARRLRSERATARILGSGDIHVHARQALRAEITGAGDITYYGRPQTVERRVLGAGDIEAGE